MKKFIISLGIVVVLVIGLFVYNTVSFYSRIASQFPINDNSALYYISCSGSMYSLNVREKKLSDISGLYIASAPGNLSQFCDQDVSVSFSLRMFPGQGLCISSDECRETFSPVIDIQSISLK